jgi:hypothetical protein
MNKSDSQKSTESDSDNVNDDSDNEKQTNHTLFVRINASGVPLNGDELIYSIYKAKFQDTKDYVEKIEASVLSFSNNNSVLTFGLAYFL